MAKYANITVALSKTVQHADFVVRHFEINAVSLLLSLQRMGWSVQEDIDMLVMGRHSVQ